ncbi:MAG: hypothetical protein EA409_07700 [Saprospirales bacterium]|nr:MAG: hypothetical protein EA409_07700 [Saprospirales bacterium]
MNRGLLSILWVVAVVFPIWANEYFSAFDTLETASEWSLSLRYSNGILMPHKEELYYLNRRPYQSFELSYEWRVDGSHRWHKIYNYPSIGFIARFSDYGDPQKLGNSYALATYFRLPLFSISSNSTAQIRLAGGGLYLERPFDEQTNHRNLAIGSHLNVFVQLMFEYSIQINNEWDAAIGFSMSHFSNGSYRKPNKGINYAQASAGFYRVFNRGNKTPEILQDFIPKREWKVMLTGALNSPHINTNSVFGVGTLNGHFNRRFSRKFFFTTGIDLVYNASNRRDLEIRNNGSFSRSNNYQVGLFGGVGMRVGKSSLVLTKGYTVISYSGPTAGFYHRFAFRRQFHPSFFYHAGIFSNYFKANFLDFGIGYTISAQ